MAKEEEGEAEEKMRDIRDVYDDGDDVNVTALLPLPRTCCSCCCCGGGGDRYPSVQKGRRRDGRPGLLPEYVLILGSSPDTSISRIRSEVKIKVLETDPESVILSLAHVQKETNG